MLIDVLNEHMVLWKVMINLYTINIIILMIMTHYEIYILWFILFFYMYKNNHYLRNKNSIFYEIEH